MQFSAGFCGFLRSSPGVIPPPPEPPEKCLQHPALEALFWGIRGAVAPPYRSAENRRNPQENAFFSFLQLSALFH
eukprot:15445868-Alexandrium_andersonii.AAC.1